MSNQEPTKEQIQRFWKWCGFKETRIDNYYDDNSRFIGWVYPNNLTKCTYLPEPDLNNLFKYAVPKLNIFYSVTFGKVAKSNDWAAELCVVGNGNKTAHIGSDSDPALALFWAIWEVIDG